MPFPASVRRRSPSSARLWDEPLAFCGAMGCRSRVAPTASNTVAGENDPAFDAETPVCLLDTLAAGIGPSCSGKNRTVG